MCDGITKSCMVYAYSIETTLHMIPDIVSNEAAQTFASRDP